LLPAGKIKEYELLNILVELELSPYAFEREEPSTPIKDVPPAEVLSSTEYSINNGIDTAVVLVKRPGLLPP
jgi:hypothetical protein